MAVMVHVGTRRFVVADGVDTVELAQTIDTAVKANGSFSFDAQIGESPLTVHVNTAVVDVVIIDYNGVGSGFFH
jgi:hypothetical protein